MQVLLASFDASNSSAAELAGIIADSNYRQYKIVGKGIRPSATSTDLQLLFNFKRAGESNFTNANYQWTSRTTYTLDKADTSMDDFLGDTGRNAPFPLTNKGAVNASTIDRGQYPFDFEIILENPYDNSFFKQLRWTSLWTNNDLFPMMTTGSGRIYSRTALTAVQLMFNSGNIKQGRFELYGIAAASSLNQGPAGAPAPSVPGRLHLHYGSTAPSGFVVTDGKTIGNSASAATGRANIDTLDLFTHLWELNDDTRHPVTPARGANAVADFNASKVIKLPDLRGHGLAGLDNMGGSGAGVLSNANNVGQKSGSESATIPTNLYRVEGNSSGTPVNALQGGNPSISNVQPTASVLIMQEL